MAAFHNDGLNEIYVMNADGTGQRALTYNRTPDFSPDWSRNVSSPPEEDTTPPVLTVPDNKGS